MSDKVKAFIKRYKVHILAIIGLGLVILSGELIGLDQILQAFKGVVSTTQPVK